MFSAEVGGTIGLYLGATLLTFFELVVFLAEGKALKYVSAGNTEPTTILDRPDNAERETERMQSKTEEPETEGKQSQEQVLHDRNSAA